MDPLSTSISSILMNLSAFLEERRGRKEAQEQATIRDYTEWLRRRDHNEAVATLESNRQLSQAIQHLLMTGQDELLERFERLEVMLNLILGATAEWGELVRSIDPTAGLSEQAIEILRWLNSSGGSRAVLHQDRGSQFLLAMDGVGDKLIPVEPRFLEADLVTLVGLDLLIDDPGVQCDRFLITRAAVKLVKSLPPATDDN